MGATILIVEDESLFARNLSHFLERRGHEATVRSPRSRASNDTRNSVQTSS